MRFTDFLEGMGRPVAYYPMLAELTGSVGAALFLCQMLYWHDKGEDPEGWIYKTREEMTGETGLSRYEQESSRRTLRKLGFLEERYAGCPRKLYYRLDIDRINEVFEEFFLKNQHNAEKQHYCRGQKKRASRAGDHSENKISLENQHSAENQHYCRGKTSILDGGKPANKNAGNQPTALINTETTTETTTRNKHTAGGPFDAEPGKTPGETLGRKEANTAIRRLMDWYLALWDGSPPEKINGKGAGRVARIFSELLTCLGERAGLSNPEEHIKRLYGFYRESGPSDRSDAWIFGDEVKSLVRFRGKFSDIEAHWKKRTGKPQGDNIQNFGVPGHILERNKRPLGIDGGRRQS